MAGFLETFFNQNSFVIKFLTEKALSKKFDPARHVAPSTSRIYGYQEPYIMYSVTKKCFRQKF